MLVAAAAMTFVSCQKEENRAPETVSAILTMHAGVDQTKTYLDENNTVLWGENESVTLFVKDSNAEPATTFVNSTSTSDFNGEASASFTFELTGIAPSASYTIGGIYPASASNGIENKNAEAYKIALPATQNASVNNYDPSAYIMVLKPEAVKELPTEYQASFRRAVALNKITLTNVPEDVTTVEITAPNKKYLAGRRYMNLTTGESGEIYDSGSQTNVVKVNGDFKAGSFDVWFCSWGVELSENDPLTVKMTSANNIYTHTINARAEGIKFVEGDLNTLKINMEHAVSMGSTPLPFTADFSGKTATGAFTELEGFEKVEGYVCNASGAIRLAKSGEGGSITTPLLDLSKNFYVRVFASGWNADELTLTVSAGDQSEDVALSAVSNGNSGPGECAEHIVNFQPVSNSASVKFAAANGKRCYIKQIEICEGHAVPAPVLKATGTEEMDATGGEGSFTVTIINPIEGKEVGATVDADWIDIVVDGNQVTYTVAENTSEERREAVITLSYENAQSVDVVITQDAKPAEGVAKEYTVTYAVSSKTAVSTSGTAPTGSNATFTATYSTPTQMTASNTQTYTLSGYAGCVIKSVTLSMHANSSKGAGTLSLKAGNQTLASISSATDFNKWYNNTTFGADWRDVNVTLTNDSYNIGANENVVLVLTGTTNSIYCQSVTITYEATGSAEGGESPDTEQPGQGDGQQTTTTYTFTSKSWGDSTNSWTSGKDGGQLTSGQGVQVTIGASGANATCKNSFSNVSAVVVKYCTNSSKGAGTIKVTIGSVTETFTVSKEGGTTLRDATFNFNGVTGTPKIEVTCTTNSIYVNAISITHTN